MTDEQTILSFLGENTRQYECSAGRRGYFRTVTDFGAADALEKRLVEEGFALCSDRSAEHQITRLWRRGQETVFIARQAGIGALLVITSQSEELFFGTEGEEKRQTGMILMNSDYYFPEDPHDNGMGMVVTLADGRFLIYDGGYPTETDGLMDYLEGQTPKGEKPVIAAWVLTHSHGDHYLCVLDFLKRCSTRAVVECFLFCAPPVLNAKGKNWDDSFLAEKFPVLAAKNGIPCYSPYQGQMISFPGVQMEIMKTVDDLFPLLSTDSNMASMATRLFFETHKGEKSVLIPGDLMGSALNRMVHLYGIHLKSDILQVPHHGVSGGTKEFYDTVDPETVLYCTSENYCRGRIATNIEPYLDGDIRNYSWNFYLMNWLHVKKAIAADGGYQNVL
ncbi:MAG: hypothetical protein J5885_04090 [Clostridia bacterium]|nr:hypothetical protein [Clostridia bacterium]